MTSACLTTLASFSQLADPFGLTRGRRAPRPIFSYLAHLSSKSRDSAIIHGVSVPRDPQSRLLRCDRVTVHNGHLAGGDGSQLRDVLDVSPVGHGGGEAHVQL